MVFPADVTASAAPPATARLSAKHLQRYVNEFAVRHNIREKDTIDQMSDVVAGLIG